LGIVPDGNKTALVVPANWKPNLRRDWLEND